jgi:hypothetical protein
MAGSSVIIQEKVSRSDIDAIRSVSGKVNVNFDATHPTHVKKPHFDIGVFVNHDVLKTLGKNHSTTFNKFRFGIQEVQNQIPNQIKYEVGNFDRDMIPTGKQQSIEHAIDEANAGRNGGFINNIF